LCSPPTPPPRRVSRRQLSQACRAGGPPAALPPCFGTPDRGRRAVAMLLCAVAFQGAEGPTSHQPPICNPPRFPRHHLQHAHPHHAHTACLPLTLTQCSRVCWLRGQRVLARHPHAHRQRAEGQGRHRAGIQIAQPAGRWAGGGRRRRRQLCSLLRLCLARLCVPPAPSLPRFSLRACHVAALLLSSPVGWEVRLRSAAAAAAQPRCEIKAG
jgi:hypothetical protein